MIFDAEVRDYVMFFFLQDLRQFYFSNGQEYGTPLDGLCERIRSVLKGRHWTDSTLNKFKVNKEMMLSISKELLAFEFIEFFEQQQRTGNVFNKKVTAVRYFKITEKGLTHSRKINIPQNPLKDLNLK